MTRNGTVIDGGNEWFPNSIRRGKFLEPKGIHFVGMGISGGEEGARYGPSLMPGCNKETYDLIEPILTKCAAVYLCNLEIERFTPPLPGPKARVHTREASRPASTKHLLYGRIQVPVETRTRSKNKKQTDQRSVLEVSVEAIFAM